MTPSDRKHRPQVLRRLLHRLVLLLGWIGFVWMWLLVAARPWEAQRLVWLIAGSFIVVPLLTAAWVLHNRSIHRRKGERRAVAATPTAYAQDWHGRAVQADWALLRRSALVLVSVDGERKLYRGTARAADGAASTRAVQGLASTRPAALGAPQA